MAMTRIDVPMKSWTKSAITLLHIHKSKETHAGFVMNVKFRKL